MKKTVTRYGIYSFITIVVLFSIGLYIGKELDYSTREIIGYTTIVVSLSFIWLGIKHYRDKISDGKVSFGKALSIGLLISLFASVAFAVINAVYVEVIDPNFTADYYNYHVAEIKSNLSGAELEEALEKMESQKELFSSTTVGSLVMFLTVFVIGFIISLISSLILQRK